MFVVHPSRELGGFARSLMIVLGVLETEIIRILTLGDFQKIPVSDSGFLLNVD